MRDYTSYVNSLSLNLDLFCKNSFKNILTNLYSKHNFRRNNKYYDLKYFSSVFEYCQEDNITILVDSLK